MARASDGDREKRLLVAKELLSAFKMERMAYIVATLLAVAFLLVVAIILVCKESYVMALGMFASSGVITYSISQLLRMWNQVLSVIFGPVQEIK